MTGAHRLFRAPAFDRRTVQKTHKNAKGVRTQAEGDRTMKAVISVVGADRVGILAMAANACADHNVNILEVAQTILDGVFSMTMIVNMNEMDITFDEFATKMEALGVENELVIRVMNQEIFKAMHTI